jgi:NAD(P)-dependent dehydrogenase (short-subunit alcohol dehydrogenase family)
MAPFAPVGPKGHSKCRAATETRVAGVREPEVRSSRLGRIAGEWAPREDVAVVTQRVAITTGANSGIGLATVVELACRGFRSVGAVRSPANARLVTEAAAERGVTVETAVMDVTDGAACVRIVERFRPAVVVNNAGFSITGAVEDIGDNELRTALETMVVAPVRLARLALPHMRHDSYGRIINVSSVYGRTSTPLTGWYQACKQALEGVSDALRAEVAADGVKVVLIEPGLVRTGIWREAERELERRGESPFADSYRRLLSITRFADPIMAEPSQVATVIADAVCARSPRARYLVGCDAQAAAALQAFVPTCIRDGVTRGVLGL